MEHPPEPESDSSSDLAQRVDGALESLWRGDSRAFDELMSDEGSGGPGVGEMFGDALRREPTSPIDPAGPSVIAGYTIRREIGRGGMGVVYEAMQEGTKRIVAVKVMLAGPLASEDAVRRFHREVQLAARLQHPNIVRILESDRLESGQPYYAMECVIGVTLEKHITAAKPDVRAILDMFLRLCDALEHAHAHGVVHRDLKPANVLIDEEGEPHILDFGLAKATEQVDGESLAASVSSPGQVLGTLRYLSPEQAAGHSDEIDARTDVYALGVMLFEALTGSTPYRTDGRPSEIIQRILESAPTAPSSITSTVGTELETIVLKALEKERDHRYASARALGDDIGRLLAGEPILARRPSSFYVLGKKLKKHRLRIALGAAVLALAAATLYGGMWWRESLIARQQQRDLDQARQSARSAALLVQLDLEGGRTDDARGSAEALFNQHRDLADVTLVWAQAHYRAGRQGRGDDFILSAIRQLRNRADEVPAGGAFRALLAEIQAETMLVPAEQTLAEIDLATPDTAEAWYLRSLATLDVDAATQHCERSLTFDSGHDLAKRRLAHLYLRTGNLSGAIATASELIAQADDPMDWVIFQAEAFMRQGRYQEAEEQCTRALEIDSENALAHRYRAVAHLCQKQYAEALEDYSLAIELTRIESSWEHYGRATTQWILGRLDEAEEDYRAFRSARGYVTYADARLFLVLQDEARRLEREDQLDSAREVRAEAMLVLQAGRDGAPPGSWLKRILDCFAGEITPDDLAEAVDQAGDERICEAHYYAGEAHLLAGRIEDAKQAFARCVGTDLPLDPNSSALDPMSEYHLAAWRLDTLAAGSTAGDE